MPRKNLHRGQHDRHWVRAVTCPDNFSLAQMALVILFCGMFYLLGRRHGRDVERERK